MQVALNAACADQLRGSIDGDSDFHQKISATTRRRSSAGGRLS
jgi:hypothetical protein